MTTDRTEAYLASVTEELRKLPRETEWLEFKRNRAEAAEIGQYLSALSNSAALAGKAFGYVIWGIDDASHEIVGTSFSPTATKVGNEELENWLLRLLKPRISFRFHEFEISGQRLVLLEIGRAFRHPVQFENQEFVRIGSYKKKLKDFPEKEAALWRLFDETPFEELIRACYLHASLRYVNRTFMTNASLRERFGIDAKNSAISSRLVKDAVDAGVIRPYDKSASRKLMKYVPIWA